MCQPKTLSAVLSTICPNVTSNHNCCNFQINHHDNILLCTNNKNDNTIKNEILRMYIIYAFLSHNFPMIGVRPKKMAEICYAVFSVNFNKIV